MRELKFRAWHKGRKEMYEVFSLSEDFVFKNTLDGVGCPGVPDKRKEVEIMQFTGCKDKNGKDIYEGDIISDWTNVDGEKLQSFCQVFWHKKYGAWHLDNSFSQDKTSSQDLWIELYDFEYEVIGNIYQLSATSMKNHI